MTDMIDQAKILEILPQKHPFVMIDKIVDFKKDESLTAIKNITGNEWVFEGQEYQTDIFPETLLIEAAAQAGLFLYHLSKVVTETPKYLLGKMAAKFEAEVRIGTQLQIFAEATKMMKSGGYSNIFIKNDAIQIAHVQITYRVNWDDNKKV